MRCVQNLRDSVRFVISLRDMVHFVQSVKDLVRFVQKLILTHSPNQSNSFFRAEIGCLIKAGSLKHKSLKETGSLNLKIIKRWQNRWDNSTLTLICKPSSSGLSVNLTCANSIILMPLPLEAILEPKHLSVKYPILTETLAHELRMHSISLSQKRLPLSIGTLAHEPISDTKHLSRAKCLTSHQRRMISRRTCHLNRQNMDNLSDEIMDQHRTSE